MHLFACTCIFALTLHVLELPLKFTLRSHILELSVLLRGISFPISEQNFKLPFPTCFPRISATFQNQPCDKHTHFTQRLMLGGGEKVCDLSFFLKLSFFIFHTINPFASVSFTKSNSMNAFGEITVHNCALLSNDYLVASLYEGMFVAPPLSVPIRNRYTNL